MSLLIQHLCRQSGFDNIHQCKGCLNRFYFSCFFNFSGNLLRKALLTKLKKDAYKLLVLPLVHHLIGTEPLTLVHTHIQWCIKAVAETALCFIKLR